MVAQSLPMVEVICTDGRPALVRPRDVAAVYSNEEGGLKPHYTIWMRTGQVLEVLALEPWTQFKRRFAPQLRHDEVPQRPVVPRHLLRPALEKTTMN